ncbi:septal ring lytic transglycosylase RlpA family protein [Polycladidibacter hongkongensis]|uniref:septal ring lytic transglycosylase RlpA family protein n=1 Tax=Polycladidibacter hongkongensis TaxID=1647556 RepID=UPI00244BBEEE|nr:septal ring lytic transglycosylase RlpA family protein [Pseudovibrio hongkongensis]
MSFRRSRASALLTTVALCVAVASCGDSGKVKFSEEKYGVAASPRVVANNKSVPKGGGRAVVGKPYKVAGKWYKPKVDPNYSKVGLASWYGPTFHGRMTANGEVFDRNGLTAAHTTMPLPSYAKVTNLNNGRSMVVRVNDRGPFHGNRIIDLSERAATLLGTKSAGVGKVKVDYIGRAPLHGRDERYLLASLSGPGAPASSGHGQTMLAFASGTTGAPAIVGPAPVPHARPYHPAAPDPYVAMVAAADPGQLYEQMGRVDVAAVQSFSDQIGAYLQTQPNATGQAVALPQQTTQINGTKSTIIYRNTPQPPQPAWQRPQDSALSSYSAQQRVEAASPAFDHIEGGMGLKALLIASAKRQQ